MTMERLTGSLTLLRRGRNPLSYIACHHHILKDILKYFLNHKK